MMKGTGQPGPAAFAAAAAGAAFSLATAMARSTAAVTASVAMANSGLEKRFSIVSPLGWKIDGMGSHVGR